MGILAFHFGKMLFTFFQPHLRHPLRLPAGTQESATRPVRRPPETVSYTAGHVDMKDVRVKIRKIVREGFNLSGSSCCSQWFREGQGWFGRARMVLGRARFQPCRYRANKNAGFYPLRDASVSTQQQK